jgi:CBS domain-containing membrane protein
MIKSFQWFKEYFPRALTVDRYERLRSCAGALIGILVTGLTAWVLLGFSSDAPSALPFLIAPMGASAVLLFAAPASPMAQPWPVVGGNIISAAVGVLCAKLIGDPPLAAAVAVAAAIGVMFLLRCLHPPGGAAALTAALASSAIQDIGFHFVLSPVALNSISIVIIAILYNKAVGRNYPHVLPIPEHRPSHKTSDPVPTERVDFKPEDLDAALREFNQVLDISQDDLETLFTHAKMHAWRRRLGDVSCADIMSRDLVTTEFGTPLEEAWSLLRKHRIKALPVVDRARRVIGIVTQSDFMKHADLDAYDQVAAKVHNFIRRTLHTHSQKPEVVGQIMTSPVRTAEVHTHIVDLVPLLSDAGFHHVPIIDDERRLVGIVTQSDMVGALYRGGISESR